MNPETVEAWRVALIEEGWSVAATYPNGEPEPHAWTARRHGWTFMALNRPVTERRRNPECSVSAWAADDLAVTVPDAVDVRQLLRGADRCLECGKVGPTLRLGFAGRACAKCRTKLAPKVEYPGWCD
jgi:hypothetical protein